METPESRAQRRRELEERLRALDDEHSRLLLEWPQNKRKELFDQEGWLYDESLRWLEMAPPESAEEPGTYAHALEARRTAIWAEIEALDKADDERFDVIERERDAIEDELGELGWADEDEFLEAEEAGRLVAPGPPESWAAWREDPAGRLLAGARRWGALNDWLAETRRAEQPVLLAQWFEVYHEIEDLEDEFTIDQLQALQSGAPPAPSRRAQLGGVLIVLGIAVVALDIAVHAVTGEPPIRNGLQEALALVGIEWQPATPDPDSREFCGPRGLC